MIWFPGKFTTESLEFRVQSSEFRVEFVACASRFGSVDFVDSLDSLDNAAKTAKTVNAVLVVCSEDSRANYELRLRATS